jgi:hypothetical protein
MIVIATGAIDRPQELGPFVEEEMRVVAQLKGEGLIKTVYRRAAGPGIVTVLEGESIEAIRESMECLPFLFEGLMTLEHEEVYEI